MEAAGLGVGVAALAGLADTCVSCFQYVQVGKQFGEDRQIARLKLDILQLRLCRWAEAVKSTYPPPSTPDIEQSKNILGAILNTMSVAERYSPKYKLGFSQQTDVADMELEKLQVTMRQMALRDQKHTSLKEKVYWAVQGKERLDRLLGELTGFINDLVQLFPAAGRRQEELLGEQTAELTKVGRKAVERLVLESAHLDPMLHTFIRKSLSSPHKHSYEENVVTDEARARYGDEVNGDIIPNIRVGSSYVRNTASGRARAQYGDSFNTPSVFDM